MGNNFTLVQRTTTNSHLRSRFVCVCQRPTKQKTRNTLTNCQYSLFSCFLFFHSLQESISMFVELLVVSCCLVFLLSIVCITHMLAVGRTDQCFLYRPSLVVSSLLWFLPCPFGSRSLFLLGRRLVDWPLLN